MVVPEFDQEEFSNHSGSVVLPAPMREHSPSAKVGGSVPTAQTLTSSLVTDPVTAAESVESDISAPEDAPLSDNWEEAGSDQILLDDKAERENLAKDLEYVLLYDSD